MTGPEVGAAHQGVSQPQAAGLVYVALRGTGEGLAVVARTLGRAIVPQCEIAAVPFDMSKRTIIYIAIKRKSCDYYLCALAHTHTHARTHTCTIVTESEKRAEQKLSPMLCPDKHFWARFHLRRVHTDACGLTTHAIETKSNRVMHGASPEQGVHEEGGEFT